MILSTIILATVCGTYEYCKNQAINKIVNRAVSNAIQTKIQEGVVEGVKTIRDNLKNK